MEYRTEEEQVEALKKWWQENGKSVLIGIGLALALIYGWKAWQGHQRQVSETVSTIYFDLVDAVQVAQENSEQANQATINHLVDKLKAEHADSIYALYASLLAAKQAVAKNDLDAAEKQLQWVVDRSEAASSLHIIARLRLARVIYAQGNTEQALALTESIQAGAYTAVYQEFLGDLYLNQGRIEEARSAYRSALAETEKVGTNNPLLTIKLNDLAQDGES